MGEAQMRFPLTYIAASLSLAMAAANAPAAAVEPADVYFQALRGLVDEAAIASDTLHTEVKKRAGSACRVRIALHHGALDDSQRPDSHIDLDLARLQPDDFIIGQRAVDDDSHNPIQHVVYIVPAAAAAVAIFDGRSRGTVGSAAFPHVFLTARYDNVAAARDTSLRDFLARQAVALLADTLQRYAETCRDAAAEVTTESLPSKSARN